MAKGNMNNTLNFNISNDDPINTNLGDGSDTVNVRADKGVEQVRLTFTSSEVGNDNAMDSGLLANQDGGLAVRMQAEDGADVLVGAMSRFDDEGITFESKGRFTFDVRDLVSSTQRGDMFETVMLGTLDGDILNQARQYESYYINAGMGDDVLTGGAANDFLVGGAGNDLIYGARGNDSFIGGGGNDTIWGGMGDDLVIFSTATDGVDAVRLGAGDDTVNVAAPLEAGQIRLTFTSIEVGDGAVKDSATMANQDGGLAVRLQTEDGEGNLNGSLSRFDDEGITFASTVAGVTFDVRDLVSGTARGDQFTAVQLGTVNDDLIKETSLTGAYYVNAGMGNDRVVGGLANDFLVGGLGDDRLDGRGGSDSFLGGGGIDTFVFRGAAGNDSILDFVSGTDKISLQSYKIDISNVEITASEANTLIDVDSDKNGTADFQITLVNASAVEADLIF